MLHYVRACVCLHASMCVRVCVCMRVYASSSFLSMTEHKFIQGIFSKFAEYETMWNDEKEHLFITTSNNIPLYLST